ncbi:hypothetical protein V5799_006243 [Amblyomma americanum]|uniref:Uncharacterized protein n=1 Tax=Amblyomma americanum TaxID=6943 RepID=A0AAQ4DWY5_AMBAM
MSLLGIRRVLRSMLLGQRVICRRCYVGQVPGEMRLRQFPTQLLLDTETHDALHLKIYKYVTHGRKSTL